MGRNENMQRRWQGPGCILGKERIKRTRGRRCGGVVFQFCNPCVNSQITTQPEGPSVGSNVFHTVSYVL